MSTVNNIGSGSTATSTTASTSSSTGGSQSLTQADFLSLLVTQMQNQDPTSPMDSSKMVTQMAQISQVQATQNMQSTLNKLATSLHSGGISSASGLIGHTVTVPSSSGVLRGGKMNGAVGVTTSGADVKVQIVNPSTGKVVRNIDLGSQNAGVTGFTWDGTADDGSPVADGTYTINASAGGTQAKTYVQGVVAGVGNSADGSGTYLQLNGLGSVALSKVTQVN